MNTPKHLAIIMDGNGRWAKARGHSRAYGHVRGARTAKNIITAAVNRKFRFLTLYAFSTENWLRPGAEVDFLMKLLARQIRRELPMLMQNNVRFRTVGDISRLPLPVKNAVQKAMEETQENTGMTLTFALSYGARQEITEAARALAARVQSGELLPSDINEALFSEHMESNFLPDPDLIIRTSGERRLSNFLLWQAAYSEFYVTDVLWPDFTETHLDEALARFARTERRFGRVLDTPPELRTEL